jgi:hypothetical protein
LRGGWPERQQAVEKLQELAEDDAAEAQD